MNKLIFTILFCLFGFTANAQFAGPDLPPASGGSFTGGTLDINTILNDDVSLSFGTSSDFACEYDTAQTEDAMVCGISEDSNNLIFTSKSEMGIDFGHGISDYPTLILDSNDNWISLGATESGGQIRTSGGFLGLYGSDIQIGTSYVISVDATTPGSSALYGANINPPGDSYFAGTANPYQVVHIDGGFNSGTQSQEFTGVNSKIEVASNAVQSGTSGNSMRAGLFEVYQNSSGTVAQMEALNAQALSMEAGGTKGLVTTQRGVLVTTGYGSSASGSGSITTSTGVSVQTPQSTAAGRTITDFYGLKIENAEATGVTNAYSIATGTGRVQLGGNIEFSNAKAMTASLYQIGRDADGTNQLHLNVPTGASFEFSVNDGPELVLNSTVLNAKDNFISWDGGQAVTASSYSVGRDSDATNQLHLNAPSGASIEMSINDTPLMTITGSNISANNQPIQNIGASGTDFGGGGQLTIGNAASAGGTTALTINMGAHTAISTNTPALTINGYTNTVNSGSSISNSSALEIQNPTYNGVAGGGTEQITDAATLRIVNSPTQGTNVTLVNRYGLLVDGGYSRFDGRMNAAKGGNVASAATITLSDGNFFIVTGTTNIDCITTTGWTAGSVAYLDFSGVLTVNDSTGGCGANTANVNVSAAYTTTANDTLTIVFDGTNWVELGRSVN